MATHIPLCLVNQIPLKYKVFGVVSEKHLIKCNVLFCCFFLSLVIFLCAEVDLMYIHVILPPLKTCKTWKYIYISVSPRTVLSTCVSSVVPTWPPWPRTRWRAFAPRSSTFQLSMCGASGRLTSPSSKTATSQVRSKMAEAVVGPFWTLLFAGLLMDITCMALSDWPQSVLNVLLNYYQIGIHYICNLTNVCACVSVCHRMSISHWEWVIKQMAPGCWIPHKM